MKLPKLTPKETTLVFTTIFIIFVILNYVLVLPWWNSNKEKGSKLNGLRKLVAEQQAAISAVPQWRSELEKLTQIKEGNVLHAQSQPAWMGHFDALAKESGVDLERYNPKELKLNQVRITCSFQGNLESTTKFLHALLTDASHPRIEDCVLTAPKQGDEKREDKLSGTIILTVVLKPSTKKS
jgi:hypothetical protein